MSARILLCSDLDRTILPNGDQPESHAARPLLRRLLERPEVTLAYVSGRNRALLEAAIVEYEIPVPSFAIGDVGTTIYQVDPDRGWRMWQAWSQEIAADWQGVEAAAIIGGLQGIDGLVLQPEEHQNTFKVSFDVDLATDRGDLLRRVHDRVARLEIDYSLTWSVDEAAQKGLLDILPRRATKLHAVRFLMRHLDFSEADTVYCGDSGNDLPALSGGIPAVLVKNACREVRDEAVRLVEADGCREKLYLARGGYLGMNGNYTAGVLEGLAHFHPGITAWLG